MSKARAAGLFIPEKQLCLSEPISINGVIPPTLLPHRGWGLDHRLLPEQRKYGAHFDSDPFTG